MRSRTHTTTSAMILRAAVIAVALALLSSLFGPAAQAGCIRAEATAEPQNGQIVGFREYLCRQADAGRMQLRVRFLSLDVLAMSGLVLGAQPSTQRRIIGDARVVENDISRELRKIWDEYGYETFMLAGHDLELKSPVGTEKVSTKRVDKGAEKKALREISEWWVDFPQPRAVQQLHSRQGSPPGYTAYDEKLYWRYLSRAAMDNFDEKVEELNRIVTGSLKKYYEPYFGYKDARRSATGLPLYLGRNGWPHKFIVLAARFTKYIDPMDRGCGGETGGWKVGYFPRKFITDVVTIENVTRKPIEIDGLWGVANGDYTLRSRVESRRLLKKRSSALPWKSLTLEPGDLIAIPVRVLLPFPERAKQLFDGPGSKPDFVDYIYGPEIDLRGVKVDGRLITLDKRSQNLLALTAAIDGASCPFVYYWDAASERWRTHGKVIHEAEGASAEASETVTLDGLVTKFRIAEEESELALINQAGLVLELDTGQKLNLPPAQDELLAKDASYIPILFGQALPVEFDTPPLPDGVKVVRSHFTVTGYYRRYSDIIAQHYQPERPSALPQLQDLPQ